ncbi:GCN5 family acetyltransferase [Methylobacterium indicum]|uniref:GNAT family N-acetyltransferase n=1 Tax=Methylobacterium indicum TaxID=1775910 RepID=UPI0007350077|nr:N-acetyltransferase [Methylobacterium indicum]KTS31701.1 GCN5 family acetyltransferase [Methylobacterium indicum]KTS39326.1 GCN5 family acetyltransferase [Methylobacterium indicum]KTS46355.1 GCN5 family acetyltransferase [Methylobacterium indicum]
MIQIRDERAADVAAREHLLDACFGEARFTKTCERLREGRLPSDGLALVVEMQDRLVATVRLWDVDAGGTPALMLGPIAVDPALHGLGIGNRLMRAALARAAAFGHRAVILVGDAPYYARFGFTRERVGGLRLPGPYAPERFLALDLVPGTLDGADGMVRATGRLDPSAGLAGAEGYRAAA